MSFISSPSEIYKGVPCFLEMGADKRTSMLYDDDANIEVYYNRYQNRLQIGSIYEDLVLRKLASASNVLSIGEGTGEFVCAMATKYPSLNFYAFDRDAERVVIAQKLADLVNLKNVNFYAGDVTYLPFSPGFFSSVVERGVFHILPYDVKLANLEQIENVCKGVVFMDWMMRSRLYYIAVRYIGSRVYKNKQIWSDAISTYHTVDPKCDTLPKMCRLIRSKTGHKTSAIYNYQGFLQSRELKYSLKTWFNLNPLGSILYDTRD